MSLGDVLGIVVAAVLVASAGMKLAAPRATHAALATFGVAGGRARWALWSGLVAAELGVAAGAIAHVEAAAYAGALLMCAFAVALERAVARGRGGQPCGCFGRRSRVGRRGVARNFALAVALGALPMLWAVEPSTQGWLATGLGVALAAVAVLAVALLALAREVGALRLALPPQSALEIVDEGPELGGRTEVVSRFELGDESLVLAVFTSETCSLCRSLAPALSFLERDPILALRVFDEAHDADVWSALAVPGSPYAVALSRSGTVLAKGSFNNLAQLESVLATAERRERDAQPVDA
jgi:methylamine utilization protein MauE